MLELTCCVPNVPFFFFFFVRSNVYFFIFLESNLFFQLLDDLALRLVHKVEIYKSSETLWTWTMANLFRDGLVQSINDVRSQDNVNKTIWIKDKEQQHTIITYKTNIKKHACYLSANSGPAANLRKSVH